MNFADYFQRDPGICGGETVLRGTRVTVRTVRAVVAFAATSAKEDLPVQSSPAAK